MKEIGHTVGLGGWEGGGGGGERSSRISRFVLKFERLHERGMGRGDEENLLALQICLELIHAKHSLAKPSCH